MNSFLRVTGESDLRATLETEKKWESTLCEIIGSFVIVFMYLCSTEDKTKFTKDSVMQTMVLAGSYLAAMTFAGSYVSYLFISPVNPAIAFSMAIFNSSENMWESSWIFMFLNFIGSLIAFFFFRLVYVRTVDA